MKKFIPVVLLIAIVVGAWVYFNSSNTRVETEDSSGGGKQRQSISEESGEQGSPEIPTEGSPGAGSERNHSQDDSSSVGRLKVADIDMDLHFVDRKIEGSKKHIYFTGEGRHIPRLLTEKFGDVVSVGGADKLMVNKEVMDAYQLAYNLEKEDGTGSTDLQGMGRGGEWASRLYVFENGIPVHEWPVTTEGGKWKVFIYSPGT